MRDPRARSFTGLAVLVVGIILALPAEGWLETVARGLVLLGFVVYLVSFLEVVVRSRSFNPYDPRLRWWNDIDEESRP
jgi:hypothetical protein